MTKQQPFLPLFFGDFLAATSEWEGEEASLYLTLLGYQWSLGSIPADPGKLCRLSRWDRKLFDRCWPQVSTKFVREGDRLTNPRLEQHRIKSAEISNKNSASGKKGASGKWGAEAGQDHGKTRAQRLASARQIATHTAVEWIVLVEICGNCCVRCGEVGAVVKDHITPIYQGGSDGIENLQPLCKTCNCAKGPETIDHRPIDWRERLTRLLAEASNGTSGERLAPRLANGLTLRSGNPSHPIPNQGEESEACQGEDTESLQ